MRVSLIIPAAGLGNRFLQSVSRAGKALPPSRSKLLYGLDGEPVLLRTLKAFQKFPQIKETIVAISPEMRADVEKWARPLKAKKIRWILGGRTRAQSVYYGLKKTSSRNDWVMVHDGARPLVSSDSVKKVLGISKKWDGAILARKVVPTIKRVLTEDGRIQETVDRSPLYEAETPQLVRRDVLLKAYQENPHAMDATDEAGLLEAIGAKVCVVPHEDWNPKLTMLPDLLLAKAAINAGLVSFHKSAAGRHCEEALRADAAICCRKIEIASSPSGARNDMIRVGIGFDTHRLIKGRKLYLGGMVIPSPKGSLGHSDGDALLHAITDAILGAIGAGDIGEWFSDRDPKFKNIRSTKILTAILEEAKRQGWAPYYVDTNIILETPKLYTHKLRIRKSVAKCLGLPEKDISIKARTREGLGPEGEGLAVTCEAIVAMKRINEDPRSKIQ